MQTLRQEGMARGKGTSFQEMFSCAHLFQFKATTTIVLMQNLPIKFVKHMSHCCNCT